jgi:hypothetical protein
MIKTILSFLLLILLTGCCKVYCDGTELIVSFERFRARETDSVFFVGYKPGTGLTQRTDSFLHTTRVLPTDTSRSTVVQLLSANYDWKITLPAVRKQFLVNNFEFTTEKCNCGGKKYKAVKRFFVNGVEKEGLFLAVE